MSLSSVSELGRMIGGLSANQSEISSQLSPDDPDLIGSRRFAETLALKDRIVIIKRRDILTSSLWDVALWDEELWNEDYGAGFIIGSTTAGVLGGAVLGDPGTDQEDVYIYCPNNYYIEHFSNELVNDDTVTDATWAYWNTTFTSGQIVQTKSIFYDLSGTYTVTQATLTSTEEDGTFLYEMSADGGTNWEEVTNGVSHSFTNTGNDLRIRITEDGASTGTINKIECTYTVI